MSESTYQQNGDYLIPNLTINQTKRSISRYGRMRRTFLQENRPILYNSLIVTGKLYPHLLEIEDAANSRMEQMMPALMEQNGIQTLGELVQRMQAQPRSGLREQVVDAMTTNETVWFRDAYPFEVLKNRVLPELIKALRK